MHFMLQLLLRQPCPLILVGDTYQGIYQFNYCCNALKRCVTVPARTSRVSLPAAWPRYRQDSATCLVAYGARNT